MTEDRKFVESVQNTDPAPSRLGTFGGLAYWLLLAVVIGIGIFVRYSHLSDVESRSPDEQVYTSYASQLLEGGFAGFPKAFIDYEADPDNWIYPPPTRFTHVFFFAIAMKFTGMRDERAGAAVSCLLSIVSLALVAWLGWRFFNRWVAFLGVAFLATCFAELGDARRAWGDATAGCLSLLVICIACEIRRAPHKRILYLLLLVAGTASLLNKETAIFAYGLCGLWLAAVMAAEQRSWRLLVQVSAVGATSVALSFAIWIRLAGSVAMAWSGLRHSVGSGLGSDLWGQMYSSGPWYQFVYLLWLVGPLTLLMACLGIAITLCSSEWFQRTLGIPDRGGASLAVFVTVCVIGGGAFGPNLQYLRIMGPANGVYCLLAGLGVWYLVCAARKTLPAAGYPAAVLCIAACLCLAALRDYRLFGSVVVDSGMEDMAVYGIRSVMDR